MRLRPVRDDELDRLAALCFRAKASWGYDAAFMEQCRSALVVDRRLAAEGLARVACDEQDHPLGVAQVSLEGDDAELDLAFVDPAAQGRGVGRLLVTWAQRAAFAHRARRLLVLSDPGARPFYEKLGARFLRMAPSDAIPGRSLPLLAFTP